MENIHVIPVLSREISLSNSQILEKLPVCLQMMIRFCHFIAPQEFYGQVARHQIELLNLAWKMIKNKDRAPETPQEIEQAEKEELFSLVASALNFRNLIKNCILKAGGEQIFENRAISFDIVKKSGLLDMAMNLVSGIRPEQHEFYIERFAKTMRAPSAH